MLADEQAKADVGNGLGCLSLLGAVLLIIFFLKGATLGAALESPLGWAAFGLLFIVHPICCIYGAAHHARARGHTGWLGIAGILGVFGTFLLASLSDLHPEEDPPPGGSPDQTPT